MNGELFPTEAPAPPAMPKRLDPWSAVARVKLGVSDDWHWCNMRVLDDNVTNLVTLKRSVNGKLVGEKKQTTVTFEETDVATTAWEAEHGVCFACGGLGTTRDGNSECLGCGGDGQPCGARIKSRRKLNLRGARVRGS